MVDIMHEKEEAHSPPCWPRLMVTSDYVEWGGGGDRKLINSHGGPGHGNVLLLHLRQGHINPHLPLQVSTQFRGNFRIILVESAVHLRIF